MALLDSEIQRIKAELGYPILSNGAEPYIEIYAVFDQIVQAYMTSGASTTSSTTVTAADTAAPVAITLASATGFAAFARVVIDVDDRQETVTVQSIAGNVITVLTTLAHTGTYPVTVEGGESIIREILGKIRSVNGLITSALASAGLKRAEDIEWYQSTGGGSAQVESYIGQRDYHRDELAAALGVANLWRVRRGASLGAVLY